MISVIGGGIIGLSCAWRLAQRGHRIRLFDRREVAAEASWAGAGMLAPGGEIAGDSSLARMALASLRQYDSFVQELREASGLPIDYQRNGAMDVAFTREEAAELDRRAELQTEIGIGSEPAGGNRFYPDDGSVDPRDLTAALKVCCYRLGVEFHEHEPVREIGDGPVVLAAGAWSSELCAALPKITPVRGHLIAYDPPVGLRLPNILRNGHTYILQRASGTIIAGSTTEHVGFDRTLDESALADIHARACRLLPALASATIVRRWNGLRPHSEGGMPFIGRVAGTSIWAACGHYRNGILLAPETARIISELASQGTRIR